MYRTAQLNSGVQYNNYMAKQQTPPHGIQLHLHMRHTRPIPIHPQEVKQLISCCRSKTTINVLRLDVINDELYAERSRPNALGRACHSSSPLCVWGWDLMQLPLNIPVYGVLSF